jgi:predicted metal-dependent phosphoesterase TrpH
VSEAELLRSAQGARFEMWVITNRLRLTMSFRSSIIASIMRYHELVGNLHLYTIYSDGVARHREIAGAAARAGLDLVVAADHNVWVEGVEGYYEGVLLLVGEEVYDVRRNPPVNHLLVYGAETELAPHAADPQRLIEEAGRRGGFCVLAHPFGDDSGFGAGTPAAPWVDWDVTGYLGLEIWPGAGLRGPLGATLRKWDELLAAGRRVVVVGGPGVCAGHVGEALAQGGSPHSNPFSRASTHLLLERPLSGDLEVDKGLVYGALRAGRAWAGHDRLASTQGFRFQARSGARFAAVGEELVRAGAIIFEVTTPSPGDIRLLRDGRLVARVRGPALRFTTAEPGVYRVEVYRSSLGRRQGWIFGNPIYVR